MATIKGQASTTLPETTAVPSAHIAGVDVVVSFTRLPLPLMESYDWQDDGLCRQVNPNAFFSPDAERGMRRQRREEAAKAMCARCPVAERCRAHALAVREPYGVWGGLTESERHELLHPSPSALVPQARSMEAS